jgi:hypothetical protein
MKKKIIRIFGAFLILFTVIVNCSNPFKSEKKKELVLEFINDYMPDTGRYIFFWDGRDDDNEFVQPGKYIVLLEIKSWQDQVFVTVTEGGNDRANDQSRWEPGFWIDHDLQTPFPDPFQVSSGVNIPILVSTPSRVKISIYKD